MAYLDASALVKLVVVERETHALRRHLRSQVVAVTSLLSRIEVPRALARREIEAADAVAELWRRLTVLPIEPATAERAGRLAPATLRSFDAIHLATALALMPDLTEFVTYDARLAEAATANALKVVAPQTR